jgi:uncharacterized protein YndB with AHSA1/START domain
VSHIQGEVLIRRPVEEVFDFVADERNEPTYNPNMVSAAMITDDPIGVGTRFSTVRTRRRPLGMQIEYTAFDRPHRLASTSRMATADFTGTRRSPRAPKNGHRRAHRPGAGAPPRCGHRGPHYGMTIQLDLATV